MSSQAGASDQAAESSTSFEVVVVGAGQAGLAIGYFLRERGRRFVIVDAADAVGSAWRARWESLTLFTPRRYSALPGMPFPGHPDGYPTRDEVIAYLEQYAKSFGLPIELNSEVKELEHENGRFRLELNGDRIICRRSGCDGDWAVPRRLCAEAV